MIATNETTMLGKSVMFTCFESEQVGQIVGIYSDAQLHFMKVFVVNQL